MKRYKLLKDLPGVKAGTTLRAGEQIYNELYNDDDGRPTGYRLTPNGDISGENPLLHSPASDWLKELPEEYKRWRAGELENYYFMVGSGTVYEDLESHCPADDCRYSIGNYFKTEEEAKKASDWLKAFTTLRDDAKGFKPEWSNTGQARWFVFYDRNSRRLRSDLNFTFQDGNLYFASEDDAAESIKTHERQWLTFFGVGE